MKTNRFELIPFLNKKMASTDLREVQNYRLARHQILNWLAKKDMLLPTRESVWPDIQFKHPFTWHDRLYVVRKGELLSLNNGWEFRSTPRRLLETLRRRGWKEGVVEGWWRFCTDSRYTYVDCFDEPCPQQEQIELLGKPCEKPAKPFEIDRSILQSEHYSSVEVGNDWKTVWVDNKKKKVPTSPMCLVDIIQRTSSTDGTIKGDFVVVVQPRGKRCVLNQSSETA